MIFYKRDPGVNNLGSKVKDLLEEYEIAHRIRKTVCCGDIGNGH